MRFESRLIQMLSTIRTVVFITVCLLSISSQTLAQSNDTIPESSKRSIFNDLIDQLKKKTESLDPELTSNVKEFIPFEGKTIRQILINRIPFGTLFEDTTVKFKNALTNIANNLHHQTSENVVSRNLFFKPNETVQPFLLADNERFLRQLPYLQDALIEIIEIPFSDNEVDISVNVKDVFSLGGSVASLGLKKTQINFREDNFKGSGNGAVLYTLYDSERRGKFGVGFEYLIRNISGTFVNATMGYQSFHATRNAPPQENYYYTSFERPLENRYMRWTYQLDLSYSDTRNRYFDDSVYYSDYRYNYYNIDAWAGYNIDAGRYSEEEEEKKYRRLLGIRFIERQIKDEPTKYTTGNKWLFADMTAVLFNLTLFRQNFVKTNYIYGFGRSEDLPVGSLVGITGGYTIKEEEKRPYLGINYEHYQLLTRKSYLSYKLRTEGFWDKNSLEDINLLLSVNYFDGIKRLGRRWKQRFFFNIDVAKQLNTVINEPLFLDSKYGLPEYGSNELGGDFRSTVKVESVFFSPWAPASFKLAPFAFTRLGVFKPYGEDLKLYSSVGGGLRIRNESLVFGTIEIKGYYFPQKNLQNKSFGFEFSTNLIFKYETRLVKRPDFIEIN